MPKKVPGYRLHKATGQAYTEHCRKAHYFGVYGTPESRIAYGRFIAELGAMQAVTPKPIKPGSSPPLGEIAFQFTEYTDRRYVKNGVQTSEAKTIRVALEPVMQLYNDVLPQDFGPVALATIRQQWVNNGLSRSTVNRYARKIVKCFKWGVSQQFVPVSAWQALTSLEPLRQGQGKDLPKVTPALDAQIAAVKPFVSRQVWALIQFQLATGCRPHEACQVRMADIDKTRDIWVYRPRRWKTQHRGTERIVYLGPVAQGIVTEWTREKPEELLWQPREARQEWLAAHGKASVPRGKFQAGCQYNAMSYGRAIERACEKAFKCPERLRRQYRPKEGEDAEQIKKDAAIWREAHCWSPNQLRHAAATKIRARHGIDAARIILGHASAVTTETYAEQDRLAAQQAVRELG